MDPEPGLERASRGSKVARRGGVWQVFEGISSDPLPSASANMGAKGAAIRAGEERPCPGGGFRAITRG